MGNSEKGAFCTTVAKYFDLADHVKICDYNPANTEDCKGCQATMLKYKIIKHQESCRKYLEDIVSGRINKPQSPKKKPKNLVSNPKSLSQHRKFIRTLEAWYGQRPWEDVPKERACTTGNDLIYAVSCATLCTSSTSLELANKIAKNEEMVVLVVKNIPKLHFNILQRLSFSDESDSPWIEVCRHGKMVRIKLRMVSHRDIIYNKNFIYGLNTQYIVLYISHPILATGPL